MTLSFRTRTAFQLNSFGRYLGAMLFTAILLGSSTYLSDVLAQDHPVVPGFTRFLEVEEVDDVSRGRLLINELNCASCHKASKPVWTGQPKQAPILSQLGNRVRPEYLERFVLDPHQVKPGTTMPNVLQSKPASERKKIATAIAHFLASTGATTDTPPLAGSVANGEKLFHSIGCVACHDPQNSETKISTSVPLGKLSEKYTIPGLQQFLSDPLKFRPSARMPHLSLSAQESHEIATYLLRDIKVKANINVAYYEGSWDKLPDFDSLKPKSEATVPNLNPSNLGGRKDDFGAVYTGFWKVAKAGKYRFRLGSDDGSRLIVDGKRIIDNDNIHPTTFKEADVELEAGTHKIRIEYFEKGGQQELKLEVAGPDLPKQAFDGLLRATEEPPMDDKAFRLDEAKARQGAEYFVSVGCANCHQLRKSETVFESTAAAAKPLEKLKSGGCLGESSTAPNFSLSKKQSESIQAALKSVSTEQFEPSAEERIHHRLTTLNCYACHERDFVGGVVDRRDESYEVYGREKWFTSDQKEMGDEGRLPPFLSGVGGKLNHEWMKQVMNNGAKERPYMMTRMPRFGDANVAELVKEFLDVDQINDPVEVEIKVSPRKVKEIGKAFVGTNEKEHGLSCIKCHTFGSYRATGIQAISLTSMEKRLNKEWFQLYMLKPSRYRPGTRMPESWPGGKSFFEEVLGGDTNKQILSIWEYLADGEKAPKPKGLIQAKLQLVATDTPRIYRNFIEGAGSRAIGIGYPAELNLAFDANNNRLAMIWQGAFIDASRHWTGRGQGYQPPLGDNVLSFPEEVAFALPDKATDKWPSQSGKELGIRFKGYRFNKQREPIFNYHLNQIKISDHLSPQSKEEYTSFLRTIQLNSDKPATVWYRAAVGSKIEKKANGAYQVDGDYETVISGKVKPFVRDSQGKKELIVPLSVDGETEFTQEYIW